MFKRTTFSKAEQSTASKIWQAIRKMQCFTLETIASQLNLAAQDIQGYVFWLSRVGYLKYSLDGFELIKDTGDRAPVALKTGFCDPNVA